MAAEWFGKPQIFEYIGNRAVPPLHLSFELPKGWSDLFPDVVGKVQHSIYIHLSNSKAVLVCIRGIP